MSAPNVSEFQGFQAPPGDQASANGTHPDNPLHKKLYDIDQLSHLPPPEWLIDGIIEVDSLSYLLGYRGRGKSFLAIDWALSVASGKPWLGRTAQQRRVLYIAAEGVSGAYQRIQTWEDWHMKVPRDQFRLYGGALNLFQGPDGKNLKALVEGEDYGLVIVDTQARCSVGAEENSSKDAGIFVNNLEQLQHAGNGRRNILTVHHAGYADMERARGSTALEGAMDSVHACAGEMPSFTLSNTKAKNSAEAAPLPLRLMVPEGARSAVIDSDMSVGTSATGTLLLSQLNSHFGDGGCSRSQLRKVCGDVTDSTFYRTCVALVTQGLLVASGTEARPYYKINKEVWEEC